MRMGNCWRQEAIMAYLAAYPWQRRPLRLLKNPVLASLGPTLVSVWPFLHPVGCPGRETLLAPPLLFAAPPAQDIRMKP